MKPDIHTLTSIILDDGYYASLPTIGPSMYPFIRSGDRIYVKSLKGEILRTGDIILFKSEKNMICHRLVKIFEKAGVTYYQTRGDAFFHKDTPIIYDQIIGKVIKVERIEISLPRKILLLLSPLTKRFTLLNASIVTVLGWIKTLVNNPVNSEL